MGSLDIFNTSYAIIYKSILNTYIDVCICDELGYILMYMLNRFSVSYRSVGLAV